MFLYKQKTHCWLQGDCWFCHKLQLNASISDTCNQSQSLKQQSYAVLVSNQFKKQLYHVFTYGLHIGAFHLFFFLHHVFLLAFLIFLHYIKKVGHPSSLMVKVHTTNPWFNSSCCCISGSLPSFHICLSTIIYPIKAKIQKQIIK